MFRRKEDEFASKEETLFGAAEGATESASVITPSASATNAAPSAYTPASSAQSHTPSQPTPRPVQDAARPAAPPTANSFRPNSPAPIGNDLSRNRMPEAKTTMASMGNVAASAPSNIAAPSSDKGNKSGRRVLTVGNDILLKGEIATCDRLVIEGKVDATLNDVHTVEIAENGSFKGSAQIEDAEISGLFEGDLVVRNRLVIYATGKVRGKITYGEIEIERGGELTGEIKTVAQAGNAARPANRSSIPAKEQKFEAA